MYITAESKTNQFVCFYDGVVDLLIQKQDVLI